MDQIRAGHFASACSSRYSLRKEDACPKFAFSGPWKNGLKLHQKGSQKFVFWCSFKPFFHGPEILEEFLWDPTGGSLLFNGMLPCSFCIFFTWAANRWTTCDFLWEALNNVKHFDILLHEQNDIPVALASEKIISVSCIFLLRSSRYQQPKCLCQRLNPYELGILASQNTKYRYLIVCMSEGGTFSCIFRPMEKWFWNCTKKGQEVFSATKQLGQL